VDKKMQRLLDPVRKLYHGDVQTLVIAAIAVLCVAWALWATAFALKWIPFPYQFDYGEGFTTFVAKLWANGQWKWDINQEPYITLMYGPLYPIILVPFIKTFGATVMAIRAVMAVSALVCLIFTYLIARYLSKSRLIGIIAALLPLAHPIIRDWLIEARIDYLALAFSIIGLYIAIRFINSKWLYLSILLFLLAFFTKQTTVTAFAAVLVFLLMNQRKKGLLYAELFVGGLALVLTIGTVLTKGGLFDHMFLYNATSFSLLSLSSWLTKLRLTLSPMVIGLLLSVFYILSEYKQKKALSIPALFWIISGLVNMFLLMRPGSFINYSLEFILATCLCAGLFVGKILSGESNLKVLMPNLFKTWSEKKQTTSLMILLVFQIAVLGIGHATPMPYAGYAEAVEKVKAIIADTSQPVITENAWLVLSEGKVPYIEPFVFTNLKLAGIWDDSKYIQDLKNQRFDYLVLTMPLISPYYDYSRFTQQQMELMESNYHLIYYYEDYGSNWYWLFVYEANRMG
jgi:hypothetical protein